MSEIIRLSKKVYQKIAAGEVIERPSSVVKELVENSLDAGADDIKIELSGGGKGFIRVIDNGEGMSPEDAEICFDRHTTSKIREAEDLDRINTLGFRGEALSSIAAVSKVVLKTSPGKKDKGVLIERKGNELIKQQQTAFPKGTSIQVRDLFFNLPVRKKFLASQRAELSRIVKHMTAVVLAYPEVKFSLKHGQRSVFSYAPVNTLRERIYQVYGKEKLDQLMPINAKQNSFHLFGYASRPPSGRKDRRYQLFWLNLRPIKDKVLQAALNRSYQPFLEKNHYPEAYLFLQIPPSEVDVNIHPTKTEVRFINSQRMFQMVYMTAEESLLKETGIKEVSVSEEKKSMGRFPLKAAPVYRPMGEKKHPFAQEFFTPWGQEKQTGPQVLGQYLNFYIIAADKKGILVIDQHNAHERILFDKYREIQGQEEWPKNMSVTPRVMEFSPSQESLLKENQDLLKKAGFEVDSMGGHSYVLKEYPDVFEQDEAEKAFLSILEEVGEAKEVGEEIKTKKEQILASMACQSAIKAGQPLSLEKMDYLVEKLFETSNPSVCPHGRPIILRISREEIEKGLGRKKG
ncbi:MAG: DNA mismatch repair endonuclease MutL [Candidatus Aminicenantes bacterium]|nr:DNA mismatch repair endonuclease MutL [Candidatus Aminicenantes bacterium]